jgi:hydrogenase-4 membrane subunit HyfE
MGKILAKVRGVLKTKAGKIGAAMSVIGASAVMTSICAFADTTAPDTSAISTALSTGVNCMALVAPYGITIFIAMLCVKKAKKFFSTMSN